MPKLIDLTGQRFGRLTVLERAGSKNGYAAWKCLCDCGKMTLVRSGHLQSGKTRSCGCLVLDVQKKGASARHAAGEGRHNESLYSVWCGMKRRCNNPNDKHYRDYGGRGIIVCSDWSDDYTAFRTWAVTSGYSEGLQIDRIDNNKEYSPDNCRWTTPKEQSRNRRSNRWILFNNETLTLAEWAERTGIKYSVLHNRLARSWSIERALTEPVKKNKK